MGNNDIYGVVNSQGVHIDVSRSLRGAKSYASRNGYTEVSVRYNCGYTALIICKKGEDGRWKDAFGESGALKSIN